MRRSWQLQVAFLFFTALLTGCGTPGVPLPPSLELAKPVTDLRAVRKGDKVYLAWSVPVLTTDRQNIRHPGLTRVCRGLDPALPTCETLAGGVGPPPGVAHKTKNGGNPPEGKNSF